MKIPARHGLRRRMLLWILGSVSLLVIVMIAGVYLASENITKVHVRQHAQHHAVEVTEALKLDVFFGRAATVGEMLKLALEEQSTPPNENDITRRIHDVLKQYPDITGCGYFFEPYVLNAKKPALWYYGYRAQERIRFDDPNDPYLTEKWYLDAVRNRRATWSSPYIDITPTRELLVTYCTPILQKDKVVGVVAVDISISTIKNQLRGLDLMKSAYYFLVDPQGHFLAISNSMLDEESSSLSQINPTLAQAILDRRIDVLEEKDPVHGKPAWITSYPVSSTDLTLAFVVPLDDMLAQAREMRRMMIIAGLAGVIGLFFVTVFIAGSISQPIEELTEKVKTLSGGNLDISLPTPLRHDEIGELTNSFNQMTTDLRKYIAESKAAAAAQGRYEGELRIARDIQMGLLPRTFPAFPERTEFDLHAIIEPARKVGGDFYDYFLLGDHTLGFVIGDVSDKGVPAAIFMAMTKTLIEAAAQTSSDPAITLRKVNDVMQKKNDAVMFVTVFLGLLDLQTGRVVYCNAGHNPPLLRRATGPVEALPLTAGVALAVMLDIPFGNGTVTLQPGDTLLLYTDGVTEAMNPQDQPYRMNRLENLLTQSSHSTVETLTAALFADVKAYANGAPQSDDIAILAIRYKGF